MSFFKKLGKGLKKVGQGKFIKGIGQVAGFVGKTALKGAGAFLASGLVPVPGAQLIGKVVNSGAAKLFKGSGPQVVETFSSLTRRNALPQINEPLSPLQSSVLGKSSTIKAGSLVKNFLTQNVPAKVQPARTSVLAPRTFSPKLSSVLPGNNSTSFLGIGDKKKAEEMKQDTTKKVTIAASVLGLLVTIAIAIFKK